MDVPLAVYSREEVVEMLTREGFTRNTTVFNAQMYRRFRSSDADDGTFVEREDYIGREHTSTLFNEVMDSDIDPKQIQPRRSIMHGHDVA